MDLITDIDEPSWLGGSSLGNELRFELGDLFAELPGFNKPQVFDPGPTAHSLIVSECSGQKPRRSLLLWWWVGRISKSRKSITISWLLAAPREQQGPKPLSNMSPHLYRATRVNVFL